MSIREVIPFVLEEDGTGIFLKTAYVSDQLVDERAISKTLQLMSKERG